LATLQPEVGIDPWTEAPWIPASAPGRRCCRPAPGARWHPAATESNRSAQSRRRRLLLLTPGRKEARERGSSRTGALWQWRGTISLRLRRFVGRWRARAGWFLLLLLLLLALPLLSAIDEAADQSHQIDRALCVAEL